MAEYCTHEDWFIKASQLGLAQAISFKCGPLKHDDIAAALEKVRIDGSRPSFSMTNHGDVYTIIRLPSSVDVIVSERRVVNRKRDFHEGVQWAWSRMLRFIPDEQAADAGKALFGEFYEQEPWGKTPNQGES